MAKQHERKNPPVEQLVGFQASHPVTLKVKKRYIKYRPWLTLSDASHILADAIQEQYIEGQTEKAEINGSVIEIDTLCVKKEGRKLIGKSWFIFPLRLWSLWYEKEAKGFFALMMAIVALLTAVVGLLAKIVFFGS